VPAPKALLSCIILANALFAIYTEFQRNMATGQRSEDFDDATRQSIVGAGELYRKPLQENHSAVDA
jgi:hypothetical protein